MKLPSRKTVLVLLICLVAIAAGGSTWWWYEGRSLNDCISVAHEGFRPIGDRLQRFLGKVQANTAGCRGGNNALTYRGTPWLDWTNYWGTGDASSKGWPLTTQTQRGVLGALTDIEYQRIELIKFNLLDNNNTYEAYVNGKNG